MNKINQNQQSERCDRKQPGSGGASEAPKAYYTHDKGGLIVVYDSQGRKIGLHSVYGCIELPEEEEVDEYENSPS